MACAGCSCYLSAGNGRGSCWARPSPRLLLFNGASNELVMGCWYQSLLVLWFNLGRRTCLQTVLDTCTHICMLWEVLKAQMQLLACSHAPPRSTETSQLSQCEPEANFIVLHISCGSLGPSRLWFIIKIHTSGMESVAWKCSRMHVIVYRYCRGNTCVPGGFDKQHNQPARCHSLDMFGRNDEWLGVMVVHERGGHSIIMCRH